jgi:hypothetical protein
MKQNRIDTFWTQNKIYIFFIITVLSLSFLMITKYNRYVKTLERDKVIAETQKEVEKIKEEQMKIKKQQEADYNLIMSGNLKKITIAQNVKRSKNAREDTTSESSNAPYKSHKTVKVNDAIKFGYLFINATVNNNYLSTYDNISFTVRQGTVKEKSDKIIGGHLIKENLLNTPILDTTLFLYRIDNINFKPTKDTKKGDFFEFINNNVGKKITFQTFINSVLPNREFKEISIYYECENDDSCIEEID